MVASLDEAGFEEIGVYTKKRQNTVAQYIVSDRFWTSVSNLFRGQESGFIGGGGSKRGFT